MYNKSLFALSEMDMIEFVAFYCWADTAPATIQMYISGARHHLKIRCLPDFQNSFLLKVVLKGVAQSPKEPDVHLPLSLDMLTRMVSVIHLFNPSQYVNFMYMPMLTLGFFGLFHLGELTFSQHVMQVDNVTISYLTVVIWLQSLKTNCSRQPQKVTVYTQPTVVCPISALANYLQTRPYIPGPLFVKSDGQAVHYNDLFNINHKLARFLQLPGQLNPFF